MSPGAFLLLALGISAVGTLLLWARSRPRRVGMNDSIAGFKRELAALSPDRSPDAFVREHSRKRSEPSLQELLHADEAAWQDDEPDLQPHHREVSDVDAPAVDPYERAPHEDDDVHDRMTHDGAFENALAEPDGAALLAIDDARDVSAEPRGYLDELYGAADRET